MKESTRRWLTGREPFEAGGPGASPFQPGDRVRIIEPYSPAVQVGLGTSDLNLRDFRNRFVGRQGTLLRRNRRSWVVQVDGLAGEHDLRERTLVRADRPAAAPPAAPPGATPPATDAMVRAIDDLDLDAVRAILRSGFDPDTRDAFGWPALLWAIDAEIDASRQPGGTLSVEVTRALLDAGASPAAEADGVTALKMAEQRGHTLAEALLREAVGTGWAQRDSNP